MIVVMGVTGSGKSSFISQLIGRDVGIGHDLGSCACYVSPIHPQFGPHLGELDTADIGSYSYRTPDGLAVRLVDTPGFNDTRCSDVEILKTLVAFLIGIYEAGIELAGLIYLHRIIDVRMQGSALSNLQVFQKLCGPDCRRNIALVMTMWGELEKTGFSHKVGEEREKALVSNDKFWDAMVQGGSRVFRHTGDAQSAREIVEHLLRQKPVAALDVQREMVLEGKRLQDTSVGELVLQELTAKEQREERNQADFQAELEEARQADDTEQVATLESQVKDCQAVVSASAAGREQLRMDRKDLLAEIERYKRRMAASASRQYPPLPVPDGQFDLDLPLARPVLPDRRSSLGHRHRDRRRRDRGHEWERERERVRQPEPEPEPERGQQDETHPVQETQKTVFGAKIPLFFGHELSIKFTRTTASTVHPT